MLFYLYNKQQMDYDYHGGLHRVAESYRETEHASCRNVTSAADALLDQANQLSFDSDLHAFLKENGVIFTQPTQFAFIPYAEDEVRTCVKLYANCDTCAFIPIGGGDQTDRVTVQ